MCPSAVAALGLGREAEPSGWFITMLRGFPTPVVAFLSITLPAKSLARLVIAFSHGAGPASAASLDSVMFKPLESDIQ